MATELEEKLELKKDAEGPMVVGSLLITVIIMAFILPGGYSLVGGSRKSGASWFVLANIAAFVGILAALMVHHFALRPALRARQLKLALKFSYIFTTIAMVDVLIGLTVATLAVVPEGHPVGFFIVLVAVLCLSLFGFVLVRKLRDG